MLLIFQPEWKLADPVCTFLFSILVLISTINILKDTLRVLMEGLCVCCYVCCYVCLCVQLCTYQVVYAVLTGTPKHINYEAVKADLTGIEGVKHAHSLQIWSLTLNRTALAVHLALGQWEQS